MTDQTTSGPITKVSEIGPGDKLTVRLPGRTSDTFKIHPHEFTPVPGSDDTAFTCTKGVVVTLKNEGYSMKYQHFAQGMSVIHCDWITAVVRAAANLTEAELLERRIAHADETLAELHNERDRIDDRIREAAAKRSALVAKRGDV